jgi:hypothetical protein
VLQRLWVVYEHHCKDEPPAMFGEVRIGAVGSAVAVAPATVRWPITDRGRPAESVPVVLTAPDDLRVTGVALAGSGTGAFVVERDECSGRSLVAGAVCYVWVDYDTGQAGTRAAALRISDSAGRVHETNLEGFAYGGRTRMVADLPRPDPFNDALHWSYGPDEALIVAVGTPQELHFAVRPGDEVQEWWGAVFAPEPGGVLTVGRTYTGASPAWDARPRLYIEGDDRCESAAIGSFTVRELAFAPDGRVRRASVELARNCPTPSSPSRRFTGVFEVRAGDTTAEPPWTGPFSPGATGPVRPLTPVEPTPAPTDPPVEPPTDPPPPAEPETPAPLPGAPPAVSVSPAPTGERGANAKGDASRRRTLLVDRRSRLRLRVACRTRPCTGIVRVRWRGQVVAARRFSSRARRPRVVLRLDRGLTRRVRAGHAPHVTVVVRVERSPVLRIRAQLRPRR